MVGNAPALRAVYRVIEQASPTAASVLMYGESGTGKELVAKTIHQLSGRGKHPFIAINCAAIPESLLENEIFGHERGAFTGAIDRRPGCFELAHTGTLFLDEIAEVSPGIQAKLLRVLQERTVRRLGGQREQAVDVRLIAATNIEPAKAVQQGKLREDLYYRINVIGIACLRFASVPRTFRCWFRRSSTEFNERNGKDVRALSPDASAASAVRLAGQHPRAPQRHRARGDSEPRRFHRGRASPGGSVRPAAAVDPIGGPDRRA